MSRVPIHACVCIKSDFAALLSSRSFIGCLVWIYILASQRFATAQWCMLAINFRIEDNSTCNHHLHNMSGAVGLSLVARQKRRSDGESSSTEVVTHKSDHTSDWAYRTICSIFIFRKACIGFRGAVLPHFTAVASPNGFLVPHHPYIWRRNTWWVACGADAKAFIVRVRTPAFRGRRFRKQCALYRRF